MGGPLNFVQRNAYKNIAYLFRLFFKIKRIILFHRFKLVIFFLQACDVIIDHFDR